MTAIATELQLSRERGVNSGSEHLAAFIELELVELFSCVYVIRGQVYPILGWIYPIVGQIFLQY